ncbi:glycosyltransferase, partial [bacterium]|nr:glycosyltransferase [bacterium]
VIVTDRCGIADFVDGKVGYVVEYDKEQLRDAICKVLNEEKLRKQFGENGKKLVMEQFTWSKIVKQLENVYLNINEIN